MTHLVLLGPTASGKSAVALELARSNPGVELVSVDSMQVYRGMDVGTAKPTHAEQAEVRHHLIDLVDPDDRFTVVRFATEAASVLAGIERRGHTAVLVGGTGLYLQAVIGDLQPPGEWPDARVGIEASDPATLHTRLAALDPVAAARIEPGNSRRLVRALEVTIGSGRPFSSFGPGVGTYPQTERFVMIGLWLPRAVVAQRIDQRVRDMIGSGLVEEVRRLTPTLGPTARQALGYKEVLAHVERGEDLRDAIEQTARRTREFSRRQRSWFRRDPRIRWHGTADDPARLLPGVQVELDRITDGAKSAP